MKLEMITLIVLVACLAVSAVSRVNVGVLAMTLAAGVGYFLAGMDAQAALKGFPLDLFILLLGVTLFFSFARANGTLDKVAHLAVHLANDRKALVPIVFFLLAFLFAAVGPGNIGSVALLAPLAMGIAHKMGINPFLTTIMLVAGANAGTFSPLSPTGLIAYSLAERSGLSMRPWADVFLPPFLAQTFLAMVSYGLFGGVQLFRNRANEGAKTSPKISEPWTGTQRLTLVCMGIFVLGVALFDSNAGFLALGLAALLGVVDASKQEEALAYVPWDAILMVCGVSTLVALVFTTGGMGLLTSLMAHASTRTTVTGVVALVSGVFSVFSSSSGVVMPTFIPLARDLTNQLGGGDPALIIASINVGSHVVDVSPLSTLGALCLASVPGGGGKARLFRELMLYALVMAVIGAGTCYLFFGVLMGASS